MSRDHRKRKRSIKQPEQDKENLGNGGVRPKRQRREPMQPLRNQFYFSPTKAAVGHSGGSVKNIRYTNAGPEGVIALVVGKENDPHNLKQTLTRELGPQQSTPTGKRVTRRSMQDSPLALQTETPRQRPFERVAKVTFVMGDKSSVIYLFQKKDLGVGHKFYFREPIGLNRNSTFNTMLHYTELQKRVAPQLITQKDILDAKKYARKSLKHVFGGMSADQIVNDPNGEHYEFNHIWQHHGGAYRVEVTGDKEKIRAIVTIAKAKHNSMRLVFEGAARDFILENNCPLTYSAEANVIPGTHIAGDYERSVYQRGGTHKIIVELNPQTSEIPSHELSELMNLLYSEFLNREATIAPVVEKDSSPRALSFVEETIGEESSEDDSVHGWRSQSYSHEEIQGSESSGDSDETSHPSIRNFRF